MKLTKVQLRSIINECINELFEAVSPFTVKAIDKRGKTTVKQIDTKRRALLYAEQLRALGWKVYVLQNGKPMKEMTIKESVNSEWGVQWTEFNNKNRLIGKKKFFKSEKDRDNFVKKIENKNNFNQFTAWSDPVTNEITTTADIAGYDAPMGTNGKKLTDFINDKDKKKK